MRTSMELGGSCVRTGGQNLRGGGFYCAVESNTQRHRSPSVTGGRNRPRAISNEDAPHVASEVDLRPCRPRSLPKMRNGRSLSRSLSESLPPISPKRPAVEAAQTSTSAIPLSAADRLTEHSNSLALPSLREASRSILGDSRKQRDMLRLYKHYKEGVKLGDFEEHENKWVLKLLIRTEFPQIRPVQTEALIRWVETDLPMQRKNRALAAERALEKTSEMREIFDALDTDCGGSIGIREFMQLKLCCPALQLPDSRLRDIFKTADTDCSGQLEFNEFCQLAEEYDLIMIGDQIVEHGRKQKRIEEARQS